MLRQLRSGCGCRTSDAPSTVEQLWRLAAAPRLHTSDEIDVKKPGARARESTVDALSARCEFHTERLVATALHCVVSSFAPISRFF